MRERKMQDWKMRHQNAGVEYAGLENALQKLHTFPGLAFSSPAFSTNAFLMVPHFPDLHFQSPPVHM